MRTKCDETYPTLVANILLLVFDCVCSCEHVYVAKLSCAFVRDYTVTTNLGSDTRTFFFRMAN